MRAATTHTSKQPKPEPSLNATSLSFVCTLHSSELKKKNKANMRVRLVSFFAPLPALSTSPPPSSSHSSSSSSRDACDLHATQARSVVVEKDDRLREGENSYYSLPLSPRCDAAASLFPLFVFCVHPFTLSDLAAVLDFCLIFSTLL